jgi:hypothetical protein
MVQALLTPEEWGLILERRARSQAEFLQAAARYPQLAEAREDRRRNLLEVARVLARYASWTDRTTRPTRALICRLAGIRLSTWKVCRALWQKWGFLGVVRQGRSSFARPAALDDGRNDAAVYVLAVPRSSAKTPKPASVTPVTRPPTDSRSESCTTHTRASERTPEDRTALRAGSASKPAVPRALASGAVLEKLSDRARAHFWGPFAAAGWTVADFRFAIDHHPSGARHRRDWRDVIYPAGWVRWRLAHWLDDAGRPVPSRSQVWAASAAAAKRASVPAVLARQAELTAAAAADVPVPRRRNGTDPGSHFEQLRAERGWKRKPMNSECGNTPPGASWPVCARLAGHPGKHESADYTWRTGQDAQPKPLRER